MTEEKWATSHEELGYFAEGEPTDAQIQLQDELDNLTQTYLQKLSSLHMKVTGHIGVDVEHDIYKLTEIRERAEELLGLTDIY